MRCEICRYWHATPLEGEGAGQCRANVPSAVAIPIQGHGIGGAGIQGLAIHSYWPPVKATEWCAVFLPDSERAN